MISLQGLFLFSQIVACIHAGTWTEQGRFGYVLLDVGINTKTGAYAASLANGVGSMILKSGDLGSSWEQLAERDGFMDIGCGSNSNDSAIITGILGQGIYTVDGGNTFHDSVGFIPGVQAIAKSRVDNQYGAPGGGGMSVTSDYGATWTHHKGSNVNLTRYGSLPSETTWYISSGIWEEPTTQFPMPMEEGEEGEDDSDSYYLTNTKRLSSKIKFFYNNKNNAFKSNLETMMGPKTRRRRRNSREKKWINSATSQNTPENEAKLSRNGRRLLQDDAIWGMCVTMCFCQYPCTKTQNFSVERKKRIGVCHLSFVICHSCVVFCFCFCFRFCGVLLSQIYLFFVILIHI